LHLHPKHTETHFTAGDTVRDVVIGMPDGLTVPFALAAGNSGAVANTHLVVAAGLAEIAAGSIAMGSVAFSLRGATPTTTGGSGAARSTRSRRFRTSRQARSWTCSRNSASPTKKVHLWYSL
jgi:hypothetical protein